jgi:hypothetical protein
MRTLLDHNKINHRVIVIDESGSMSHHRRTVEQVMDGLIRYLGEQSKDYDQETRISVYAFNSRGTGRCLVYDTDVLRIPSIAGRYQPGGLTALIDCVCLAITDLREQTGTKYGDHSFWVTAISDGAENDSALGSSSLRSMIALTGEEWTIDAYVPDKLAQQRAEEQGFHPDNITVWDPSGSFEEIGRTLRETATRYMEGRQQGVRGYRTGGLFTTFTQVSVSDIERTLTALTKGSYTIETNTTAGPIPINQFVPMTAKRDYHAGVAFYQFGEKTVKVQATKDVFVQTGGPKGPVYGGQAARDLLGLPKADVMVHKARFPDYSIFVQSTSYNRNILPGQRVLVLR